MRLTTGDLIYEKLRNEIICLEREPGAELSLTELCGQFDVSRSPVRDALVRLREDGLVDLRPQRGCRVTKIDLGRVDEECFLRQSLEQGAMLRFQASAKQSDLARMEYFLQLQREAAERDGRSSFFEAYDSFHAVFYQSTGLERTWELIECETGNHRRLRVLSLQSPEGLARNIKEHEELMSALKAGDFQKAIELETDHLMVTEAETGELIGSYPEYFTARRE